jgi:hypothetical protein
MDRTMYVLAKLSGIRIGTGGSPRTIRGGHDNSCSCGQESMGR